MFPYDAEIATLVKTPPETIPEVLDLLRTIDVVCVEGDGLKWFNGLYLEVTQAVANRVAGLNDPRWVTVLDVQFASLYFSALYTGLTDATCPACWKALLAARDHARIARIQFALAGMNAHINHDLPVALVATAKATNIPPEHGTPQYQDYGALNATLDSLIETAKRQLNVRLLGDPLPVVSHLENLIAAWNIAAAREQAWNHSEALWHLQSVPLIAAGYVDGLDGLVTFGNKALLVPAP